MELQLLPDRLAICRLDAVDESELRAASGLFSVTRTADELSVVCPAEDAPQSAEVSAGWRALKVHGPLDHNEVGVLASIAAPLADAGVSLFPIATYDTDYVLVKEPDLERALAALDTPDGRQRVSSGSPFEPRIGFSRAVRAGDRVLVSGTGPVMPDGGCPESTLEQARRCWEIVVAALGEAGATAADVVRTRTLLTPAADAEQAMAAHGEVFKNVRPASTMLVIHSLLDPRWTVEVEAEAQLLV